MASSTAKEELLELLRNPFSFLWCNWSFRRTSWPLSPLNCVSYTLKLCSSSPYWPSYSSPIGDWPAKSLIVVSNIKIRLCENRCVVIPWVPSCSFLLALSPLWIQVVWSVLTLLDISTFFLRLISISTLLEKNDWKGQRLVLQSSIVSHSRVLCRQFIATSNYLAGSVDSIFF